MPEPTLREWLRDLARVHEKILDGTVAKLEAEEVFTVQ